MFEWALVIASLMTCLVALGFSAWAVIQVEALKRSTHQVTFLDPTKQAFETLTEDVKAKLTNV